MLDAFPRLMVIGAHFCGWSVWDEALEALREPEYPGGCSSSFYALEPDKSLALIRGYGAERVLFGQRLSDVGPRRGESTSSESSAFPPPSAR